MDRPDRSTLKERRGVNRPRLMRVASGYKYCALVGSLRNSSLEQSPFAKRGDKRSPTRRFAVIPDGVTHGPAKGEMLARISTELVQLHSRYYGKGPTKAKTHLVDDTVLCLLRGGFTTVERTLIGTGQQASVLQMRHSFQEVMEDEFRNVVEEATGRKVIAYMSMVHAAPELAAELFMLEPLDESETVAGASGDGAKPEP